MPARKHFLYGFFASQVLAQIASAIFLLNASPKPDPATGRTMAYLFAPEISKSPSYITYLQGSTLAVIFGAGIVCFLIWALLGVRGWLART